MPASQTSVVNDALRILGAKRVASIDADVRTAKVMRDAWDDALEYTLGLHQWKFANKRVELPRLSAAPAFGYDNAYELPADYVIPRRAIDHSKLGYQVEGRTIISDIGPPLQLIYTHLQTDMTVWHALARKALAATLAIETAETITGSRDKVEEAHAVRKDALAKARPIDGQQDPPQMVQASEWLDARGAQGPMRTTPDDTAEDF